MCFFFESRGGGGEREERKGERGLRFFRLVAGAVFLSSLSPLSLSLSFFFAKLFFLRSSPPRKNECRSRPPLRRPGPGPSPGVATGMSTSFENDRSVAEGPREPETASGFLRCSSNLFFFSDSASSSAILTFPRLPRPTDILPPNRPSRRPRPCSPSLKTSASLNTRKRRLSRSVCEVELDRFFPSFERMALSSLDALVGLRGMDTRARISWPPTKPRSDCPF